MIVALQRRRTFSFSSWSLGVAIAIQLLGCSAANDIDRSPEIFVAGGYLNPEAIAAAGDRDDVYLYAGESTYGESAVAVRLSIPTGSRLNRARAISQEMDHRPADCNPNRSPATTDE